MNILHISDTHIGNKSQFNEDSLKIALKEIGDKDIDILIHSGDITRDGNLKNYKKAREIFDKVEVPLIVIPGNHDKRSGGLSIFKDYFDSPDGVFESEEEIVIYVDSAVPDTDIGRVGMVKFDMIKEALAENSDKSVKIVVLHHHVVPVPKAGRERNVLSNAGDLLELFLKGDVDLVLSGHRHYPNVHRIENTVFVNAGTISDKKTRYGDINSYNLIQIKKDRLKVKTKRVDGSKKVKHFPRKDKRIFYHFGDKIFRIVHISNTFISSSTRFLHTHFFNALKNINSLDADLTIHCGGIVEEGINQNFELAKKYMEKFTTPIIYTPAGRDINYLGYELFSKYFGEMIQSYRDEKILFQGVSSAQYDSLEGYIGERQREKLFERLGDRKQSFKSVFLHHNILPIPHAREKGLLEDSGDFLREVVDQKIELVLTGTSSHPSAVKIGDTVVVNANSLSSVYQRSRYGNSFNVIDIYEKVIVVYEINSLWGTRKILGVWERNGFKKN
ncbi:MAG: metallophosphoesterase [Candidatus Thermoplasmatota archaeon]|nr:metallophosphoesterase [Candidatus Thermoplasmatota archaeon]MBS3789526.1 metallophosphoesterase [Candidatus Thermoplasmatota archaeon]